MKDFKKYSQPDDENWEKFDYKFVGVVGGYLCMLCSACNIGFEIWVMNDYGVKASWAKLFHIDQVMSRPFNYLRSIIDLRNNEILLDDEKSNSFILYDTKRKSRIKHLRIFNVIFMCMWRAWFQLIRVRVREYGYRRKIRSTMKHFKRSRLENR